MYKNRERLVFLLIPAFLLFPAYKNGAPDGYSGSFGDKGSTCAKCHTGTATIISGWITTNIPTTGYLSNQVYEITLTASDANAKLFGFDLTAEDNSGAKTGIFSVLNSPGTKLINTNKTVTHTSSGTAASGNSKIWVIEWTAPAEATGTINFFAAINAANGNGTNSGDIIYKTSISVNPVSTGIELIKNSFQLYPNPASGLLTINISDQSQNTCMEVFDIQGKLLEHYNINNGSNQINLSHLPKGLYIMKFTNGSTIRTEKIFLY